MTTYHWKNVKRVEKLLKATADMYKVQFDVWTGYDKKDLIMSIWKDFRIDMALEYDFFP